MKSPALTLAPLCFLFVLMVSAVPLRAQALILRGGMNISNAVRDPETSDPFGQDPRLGFNAALLGDIPAGTYTHVLVGAGYEQRGIQITFGDDDYVLSADYITVPVMLSLRTPSMTPGRASARFFLNLGVEPAFLVASDFDVGNTSFEVDRAEDFDFGLRGELGIELPFRAVGPGALVGVGYTYSLTDADSNDDSEWHNYAFHLFVGLKLGRF